MALGLTQRTGRGSSPGAILGWRLVGRLGLLLAVLTLVFAAVDLLPGSAARGALGAGATDEAVAATSSRMGLDQAWPVRFGRWIGGLFTGDLGSTLRGEPVSSLVSAALPETLMVVGGALVLTVPISIVLGTWWATRAGGSSRRVVDGVTTAAIAIPEFVVATVLIVVFALVLNVLPAATITNADGTLAAPDMRVLPIVALTIPQVAWNTRIVRAAVTDRLDDLHVQQARFDGVDARRVIARHVIPPALPTIAAAAATSTGMLLGGAVVVETVFNHPGIGSLLSEAVTAKDSVTTASIVALVGVLIALVLTASDAVSVMITGRAQ